MKSPQYLSPLPMMIYKFHGFTAIIYHGAYIFIGHICPRNTWQVIHDKSPIHGNFPIRRIRKCPGNRRLTILRHAKESLSAFLELREEKPRVCCDVCCVINWKKLLNKHEILCELRLLNLMRRDCNKHGRYCTLGYNHHIIMTQMKAFTYWDRSHIYASVNWFIVS